MSNMGWVDKAWVGILPDARQFAPELDRAITRALNEVERKVNAGGGRITRRFQDLARDANRALDGISGRSTFDRLETQAERAARGIENAFDGVGGQAFTGLKADAERAARGIEDAFDRVGDRAFDGLQADANRAAEGVEAEFQEAQRGADRSLRGIGGPGQFRDVEAQADRAADRIHHSFLRARTSASFSLGALSTRASVAGGVISAALGTVGTAAVTMGLQSAAAMEQAQISFGELLGSGAKAKAFLEDLNQFAATTPFEMPGLISAARSLLGAGQAAKDVIPIMTALGDATGALGLDQEAFGRIMLATTQAMNKGRLQGEELMQMQEAGLPVTKMLADAMGVSTKRISELSQAGKLQSDEVLPKLFDQMHKDYGGSMIKQSRTLNGLWSTFVDTTRNALREGIQPLLPAIKDALPEAARVLEGAIRGVVGFFRDDLGPELGRLKQAWNDNGTAILGLFTNMASGRGEMDSSATAAHSLADSLVFLTNAAGDASRFLDQLGHGLNVVDETSDRWGSTIHERIVSPMNEAIRRAGEWVGVNQLVGRVARDVTADLADMGIRLGQNADTTSHATSVTEDYTAAVRDQRAAIRSLNNALDDEKVAQLDVRQAELNVQQAQQRLNQLKRQGKQGSLEYRQAQLSLERAQINLTTTTQAYNGRVAASREAERRAASASDALRGAQQRLREATLGASRQILIFGDRAQDAFAKLRSKTVKVQANYNVSAPKGVELLFEKGLIRSASGGPLRGPGTTTSDDIPVLASDQEHMVAAREVLGLGGGSYERGHQMLKQMRSEWRRYAAGGPVLKFEQQGTDRFLARPPRFDRNLERSLDVAARGFVLLIREHASSIFGGGKENVKAFIRSMDPLRYCWGGAGPACYDCSGAVGAVHLAHLGRPHGHGQRIYTTGSIHAGLMGLKPGLGGTLEIGVTAGTGHMAAKYGGLGIEARSTRTGIFTGSAARDPRSFARHYHLAQGGPVTLEELQRRNMFLDVGGDPGITRIKVGRPFGPQEFDRGGYLRPGGWTPSWNGTGRRERVLDPVETRVWEALEKRLARAGPGRGVGADPAATVVQVQSGAVQVVVQGPVSPAMLPRITSSVEDGLQAVLREFRTGTAA